MTGHSTSPTAPIDPTRPGQRWRLAAVCLGLATITFVVFGQTLSHAFIDFDDNEYVYENPVVARGLTFRGIVWAFARAHSANWHPLTWISHMLDVQLYGLHPGGHHLTNVLIHIATVIALFLVLRQMTGALWKSAFVAAVFAIHPLRAESVAWVAERKDVLSGLFFMLTISAYTRYARLPGSLGRYGLVLFMFAMGLMCKPMLVTLPLVLLLLDFWPLQRKEPATKLLIEKLPLLLLSAISAAVTYLAQSGAMLSTEAVSLPMRIGNAFVSCWVYLGQMAWPAGLAAYYPLKSLSTWDATLAGLLLAGFSAVAWKERGKHPWVLTGWFWYLVMLLPVIGIVQVGAQAHADRYTYLPQIGICVAVTWLAEEWGAQRGLGHAAFASLAIAAVAVLMVCAWKQTTYWENSETLWRHAIACTTDNKIARLNLGHDLLRQGKVDEAIDFYKKGLESEPNNAASENNIGNALREKGQMDEAIAHYRRAVQIKPGFVEAEYNLGKALSLTGKMDEAISQFQKALQIDPGFVLARINLGNDLLQLGKPDQAVTNFEKVLETNPNDASIHLNLGLCFSQLGRMDEAILQDQLALQINPADAKGQNNLAWLLATCPKATLRNGGKAVELASQANERTGGTNPIILHTLAAAFAEAGRFSEAVGTAQRASQLAESKSMPALAKQLQSEIKLYQANSPLHLGERAK